PYTLSLHDALPISVWRARIDPATTPKRAGGAEDIARDGTDDARGEARSVRPAGKPPERPLQAADPGGSTLRVPRDPNHAGSTAIEVNGGLPARSQSIGGSTNRGHTTSQERVPAQKEVVEQPAGDTTEPKHETE